MESRYIFIHRPESKKHKENVANNKNGVKLEDLLSPIYRMLKTLFSYKENGTFSLIFEDNEYDFEYKKLRNNHESYSFCISVDYTPAMNAMLLDEIDKVISKGEHRKNFDIVLSYSGSAEYYCNKLYPIINKFERSIRDIIFLIVIETYGRNWFDTTVSTDVGDQLKGNGVNKNTLIENALYEMTIKQLEDYLFSEWRDIDSETFINNALATDELEKLTKDEIITLISKNKPCSLWERIFLNRVEIDDLQEKLSSIRKCRNTVAHSKNISTDAFRANRAMIKKLNNEIKEAHELLTLDEGLKIQLGVAMEDLRKSVEALTGISKVTGKSISEALRLVMDNSIHRASMRTIISSYNELFKDISKHRVEKSSGTEQ